MRRHKNGAAVFVWPDRNRIRLEAAGQGDYLFFVKANQRAQYRQVGNLFDGAQAFQCLTGHLTQVFPGNKRQCPGMFSQAFGDAEHHAAHQRHQQLLRCFFQYFLLNLRKIRHMKP